MKKKPKVPLLPKGSNITVEPIRKVKDIQAIKKLLATEPRNHLLFVTGINNGIRTGDLLRLKVEQVRGCKVGDVVHIRESKTKKDNIVVINKSVFKALCHYLATCDPDEQDFLFPSKRIGKALTVTSASRLIQKWTKAINLKGQYGAHTLRKTWGYHQRVTFKVGFEIIAKRYNHTSHKETMRYLGIEDKEVHSTLMNEVG